MDVPAPAPNEIAATIVEIVLILIGVFVLVRYQFSKRAAPFKLLRLEPWSIRLSDFLLRALAAVVGALVGQVIVTSVQKSYADALSDDQWLVVQGIAFQVGVIAGVLLASARAKTPPILPLPMSDSVGNPDVDPFAIGDLPTPSPDPGIPVSISPGDAVPKLAMNPLLGGLLVFLASLPLVLAVAFVWQAVLKQFGVSVEQQEMIDLLTDTDSPFVIVGMGILAVVTAPLMEETVFRAGLFRYLRTRVPRVSALIISAVLFSALHANVAAFAPLVVFGIVLAIAYERTGRIEIPMVAHALFNLHTLALLLAGVNT